jgi:YfiH family protein
MFLESELLKSIPGIRHGFGTLGEEFPSIFEQSPWPKWRQVHGAAVAELKAMDQDCGDVDALWTAQPGACVAVVTADCVPVLVARADGARVAAIHAGWRGTRARVVRALFDALAESPRDYVAAVGPAIGPCCYEVSEELADEFAATFAGHGAGVAVPRHRHLDLPAINAAELRALGVGRVDLIRACTRCVRRDGQFLFHSYRREGGGTRQFSVIGRKK